MQQSKWKPVTIFSDNMLDLNLFENFIAYFRDCNELMPVEFYLRILQQVFFFFSFFFEKIQNIKEQMKVMKHVWPSSCYIGFMFNSYLIQLVQSLRLYIMTTL